MRRSRGGSPALFIFCDSTGGYSVVCLFHPPGYLLSPFSFCFRCFFAIRSLPYFRLLLRCPLLTSLLWGFLFIIVRCLSGCCITILSFSRHCPVLSCLSFSFLSLPLAQVYLSSLFPLLPFLCCGGCALRKFRVSGFSCLFCSTSTFPRYFFRCFYVLASSSHLWGFPAWGSRVRIRLLVAPTLLLPQVIVLFGS